MRIVPNDMPSTTPNPNPANGDCGNNCVSGTYPVDLTTPLFSDDFNRTNEILTNNTKWTTLQGFPVTNLTDNHLDSSDNDGMFFAIPNISVNTQPSLYLESTLSLPARMDSLYYGYGIFPYADLGSDNIIGCGVKYNAQGDLLFYAGSYEDIFGGTGVPVSTISGYSLLTPQYVGCEVNVTSGTAAVYLNSIKLGETSGLNTPQVSGTKVLLLASGRSIIIDNVKAFNSFSEARELNEGDLKIYNTPFASYYVDHLSNFSLKGYCAHNGAKIQIKDVAPNNFQSSIETCMNNAFTINVNLSDLNRFPLGLNQLRLEYVNSGNTTEYFWSFVKSNTYIGPDIATIPFITKWKTDNQANGYVNKTSNTQIQLPLVEGESYNFTVDWGDGTSSTITSWNDPNKIHDYGVAGEYTVSMLGFFPRLATDSYENLYSNKFTTDPWKLIDVSRWGNNKWRDMSGMFRSAHNLNISATDVANTDKVTSMNYMFALAVRLNNPLRFSDTKSVKTMEGMFTGATSFNQPINFDTSSVTNMNYMFMWAYAFNQPLNFDTKSVKTMSAMFSEASAFNQPLNFDTSSVTNMDYMFSQASAFNQPLNFDTSNVTTMERMFFMSTAFNQQLNFDTSNVSTMREMFSQASSFNQPLSFNTSNVTNMSAMFSQASSFNQPLNFDTSSVTNMDYMFSQASAFNQNLTGWIVNPNVTTCGSFANNANPSWVQLPNFASCHP